MIETVTMFRVVCDGCGSHDDDSDYYAWVESDQAREVAVNESGWLVTGPITDEKHWCPSCTAWDEEEDQQVPKAAL